MARKRSGALDRALGDQSAVTSEVVSRTLHLMPQNSGKPSANSPASILSLDAQTSGKEKQHKHWVGSRATLFRTPPGPAIQLATKPAFHLVIRSSLNPTEIPLNLTENPLNLTERARNQTERIAVSNAALNSN